MADPAILDSPDFDAKGYVASRLAAAQDGEAEESFTKSFDLPSANPAGRAVGKWMMKLPKNVSVGMIDAAMATEDFVDDLEQSEELPEGSAARDLMQAKEESRARLFQPVGDAVKGFRDHLAEGSNTADAITQGIAQFAIPFTGFAKGFGALRAGISFGQRVLRGGAAEVATSSTALDPHADRLGDLLQLGKEAEGKLGEALRAVAPDGSLLNSYINWMTEREDEGEWEGRFKNSVDSLVGTAVIGGLLKTAATTFKIAKGLPGYIAETAGTTRQGRAAQEGMVAFHGTGQENIEKFDISKVGTGQGAQTFGHGLYFAENPKTAGHYREMLSQTEVSPAMDEARAALKKSGGDEGKAFQLLNARSVAQRGRGADAVATDLDADLLREAAQMVKSGDAARKGGALYTVDIPDQSVEKMLDWDKPLSQQSDEVRRLIAESPYARFFSDDEHVSEGYRALAEAKGGQDLASAVLNISGIPGIKFFDQGSRDAGKGTRNIVLFDDKLVKILKKE